MDVLSALRNLDENLAGCIKERSDMSNIDPEEYILKLLDGALYANNIRNADEPKEAYSRLLSVLEEAACSSEKRKQWKHSCQQTLDVLEQMATRA